MITAQYRTHNIITVHNQMLSCLQKKHFYHLENWILATGSRHIQIHFQRGEDVPCSDFHINTSCSNTFRFKNNLQHSLHLYVP